MTNRIVIALFALAICMIAVIAPVSADKNDITAGDTVLVGESGLNVINALGAYNQIAWWTPGSNIASDSPNKVIRVTSKEDFPVSPATFEDREGAWYQYNGDVNPQDVGDVAFYAEIPTVTVKVWDTAQSKDVSGQTITSGQPVTFRIDSNADQAALRHNFTKDMTDMTDLPDSEKGLMKLVLKTPSGGTLNQIYVNGGATPKTLTGLYVNTPIWYWSDGNVGTPWDTSKKIGGSQVYPAGTYTVQAEFDLNYIKDNYEYDGASYVGRTVSATKSVTIATDTVKLVANSDAVVRSNSFSLTITGKSNTAYYLWVK